MLSGYPTTAGRVAQLTGAPATANPYPAGSAEFDRWASGWAQQAALRVRAPAAFVHSEVGREDLRELAGGLSALTICWPDLPSPLRLLMVATAAALEAEADRQAPGG